MISFVGAATAVDDAASVSVDISALGAQAGDVAVAMVSYGNPAAPPPVPSGWARVTGASIKEDVELAGELLARFLGGAEQSFAFAGLAGGPIAAGIAIYRGVSHVAAAERSAETIGTVGSTSHATPATAVEAAQGLACAAYFFWYLNTGATPDAAQTERLDVASPGAPRAVSIMLSDEQVTPGALAARTATTIESGLGNAAIAILTAADESVSAFEVEHGIHQGRLENDPVEGAASFVLGSDLESAAFDLSVGDHVEAVQVGEMPGDLLRSTIRVRVPDNMPAGQTWRISLRIDGTERAAHRIERSRTVELAANISGEAPGDHEVAFRLELVAP